METRKTKGHMANLLPNNIQNACDWTNMRNWKVFPVNPETKAPYIKDPFGRAVSDRDEVIDLFKDFPGAGIGIPTGPSNRFSVADVDRKNGVDGWFNLRALEIDLPTTAVVHTPSGGFHLYYETGDLEIPNSVGQVATGVDVRGAGGYVVGPGTINSKGKYTWDTQYLSPLGKLAKMPSGLLRHCMGAQWEDAYSTGWRRSPVREELMDIITEGRRNNTMASRIGYLIKKLDADLAWEAAQHINATCCKPPLDHKELENTFRSILKRDTRNG